MKETHTATSGADIRYLVKIGRVLKIQNIYSDRLLADTGYNYS